MKYLEAPKKFTKLELAVLTLSTMMFIMYRNLLAYNFMDKTWFKGRFEEMVFGEDLDIGFWGVNGIIFLSRICLFPKSLEKSQEDFQSLVVKSFLFNGTLMVLLCLIK